MVSHLCDKKNKKKPTLNATEPRAQLIDERAAIVETTKALYKYKPLCNCCQQTAGNNSGKEFITGRAHAQLFGLLVLATTKIHNIHFGENVCDLSKSL